MPEDRGKLTSKREMVARIIYPGAWGSIFCGPSPGEQERALSKADAIIAALIPEEGWRPIERAPRDGTRIITWQPDPQAQHEAIQRWQTHDDDGRVAIDRGGQCAGNWSDDEGYWCAHPPTHWRPLPSAPLPAGRSLLSEGEG